MKTKTGICEGELKPLPCPFCGEDSRYGDVIGKYRNRKPVSFEYECPKCKRTGPRADTSVWAERFWERTVEWYQRIRARQERNPNEQ